ncbi:cytochrome P450 [Tricladium varicosporioides]|nr:cytochrome P450 [Hymenoscyphus varicosporioides]
MDDSFYEPLANITTTPLGWISSTWQTLCSPNGFLALFLGPILIAMITRYMTGRPTTKAADPNASTVWMVPYWIPFMGHAFDFMWNPLKLMQKARDLSPHEIFALKLGGITANVVSDPVLVKSVMAQKQTAVEFDSIAWTIIQRFFAIPKESKPKYIAAWDELNSHSGLMMREPHMSNMLQSEMNYLEKNIANMITFARGDIDLQPWERWAKASFISSSETEINLMALLRDMMGAASVPAMFGSGLLEKYPDILHDIYEMDNGMVFLIIGLPAWFPWPGVMRAHLARSRLWQALDDLQMNMDKLIDGEDVDYSWGELDDISEFIIKRHLTFKNNNFEIRDRGDLSMLWALVVNASLLVYWQVLYIFATPGLLERIRAEIAPYASVSKPESIGKFTEAPKLRILQEGLAKNCPLLKATYFEALRLSDQPWSVRKVASDVTIYGDKRAEEPVSFQLHRGEYITVPHDLHMKDSRYFKDPEKFDPERFLVTDENGKVTAEIGTIRPYGGGPSMCKGRVFAERECLALVAGVVAYWDIEPVDKKAGWVIPKMVKTTAVSKPLGDSRVRIKRRAFKWK